MKKIRHDIILFIKKDFSISISTDELLTAVVGLIILNQ